MKKELKKDLKNTKSLKKAFIMSEILSKKNILPPRLFSNERRPTDFTMI